MMGSSPGLFLRLGRSWFGLAAAGGFLTERWPAVAVLGGSSVGARGKMASRRLGDAPRPINLA
jgi:hypothetical protein